MVEAKYNINLFLRENSNANEEWRQYKENYWVSTEGRIISDFSSPILDSMGRANKKLIKLLKPKKD